MRKKKVITHYRKFRLDELHTLAGKISESMRDNPDFPDAPIDGETLLESIQDFQQKWETAKDGGSKWDKVTKDEARDKMLSIFSQLATHVNFTADGNLPLLVSSGFILQDDPKGAKQLFAPEIPKLSDGWKSGQMLLRFQKVPTASSYEYQYTNQVDEFGRPIWSDTLHHTTVTSNNVIDNTEYGTEYFARVRARNRIGASDWSEVVKLLAR